MVTKDVCLQNSSHQSPIATHPTKENSIIWISEIIRGRLYFALLRKPQKPSCTHTDHFFSTDDDFNYIPYNKDFGPLSLAQLIRYCSLINGKLRCQSLSRKRIVHCSSLSDPYARANASYLLAGFTILCLGRKPADAIAFFLQKSTDRIRLPEILPFRDASPAMVSKTISLFDCLSALHFALRHGFICPSDFDVEEYERLQLLNLNWIAPRGLIAFAGPLERGPGYKPEVYVDYFKTNKVRAVVRLNQPRYDPTVFTKAGICFMDWEFPDGAPPPSPIVRDFLKLCDQLECVKLSSSDPGVIAVHCKAGLGRTGTLIATRLMSEYGMRAKDAVAWIRMCRPGSVMSLQQDWLESNEHLFMENFRKPRYLQHMMKMKIKNIGKPFYGIYSIQEKFKNEALKRDLPPTGGLFDRQHKNVKKNYKLKKGKLNIYDLNIKYPTPRTRYAAKFPHVKYKSEEEKKITFSEKGREMKQPFRKQIFM